MDAIKMKGRLLLFDKPTLSKTLFPKNCEVIYPEKIPVIFEFRFGDPRAAFGSGCVMRDEKGLICEVELTRSDVLIDILHEFNGDIPIGGFYSHVKSHQENGLRVFESGCLRAIGVTLSPVDEEYRLRVVGEKEKQYESIND